ncbi:MAG TPA: PEP-CTERM sorting domain-containing protein [Pyrinomonadaceae bacterium]|jgi:hypothetical protein|nr:PEP-CTERM sorting domain-containing protein [Pyrinomonadaceae bacterium]
MKKLFTNISLAVATMLFVGFAAGSARADIVYLGRSDVQPAGQGVVPTVLTIQELGAVKDRDGIESGAVRRVNGRDVREGDAKNGVNSQTVLFSELRNNAGVQNASQLGIFLDIVEPGNDNLLTISGSNSLVLTAYNDAGAVLGQFFYTGEFRELTATPGPGGGRADHVFGLDSVQAAQLQALINSNSDLRLGLAATLGSAFGGPDHFFFGNISPNVVPPNPVPEPATLLLLGTGMAGIAAKIRKRRKLSAGQSEDLET